jgi:2-polyprenyl-6-methoxyphenol hydroxylase-like FAD-dependent oxidoreductase
MAEAEVPVVIAGGGPVGLALALGLARQGVRSLVLEQDAAITNQSRALGVLPRTMEILRNWGVLDRFLARGALRTELTVYRAEDNAPVGRIDLSPLARHTKPPGILILAQHRTQEILLAAVRESAVAEVRFGHAVTAFQEDTAGVTVQVTPQEGEPYAVRGAYLAGCDGAHSVVRGQLGWHLEGKTYPARVALADVRLSDDRDQLPWPRVANYGGALVAGIRFEEQHWRIIHPLPPRVADADAVSPPALAAMVERLFGPGPFESIWANGFRIHCRTSPHFRQGRVMLVGDAAHINSPAGGQGMNSGIQDAQNLAWKLARRLDGGIDDLLVSYEQERRGAVVNDVERYTDFLTRTVLLAHPWVRAGFLGLGRTAASLPWVAERAFLLAGMLGTHYRQSALLRGGGRWLGRRPPDGDLVGPDGTTQRLLDLAGPDAALLLFDDGRLPDWNAGAVREALAHVPRLRVAPLRAADSPESDGWRDATGTLWRAWAAAGDMAVLLRPDGFVGWQATRPSLAELRAGVESALGQPARS